MTDKKALTPTLDKMAIDHPYYASESNFYTNERSHHYENVADFLEEMDGYDIDMNLVYRWDIKPIFDDDDNPIGKYSAQITIILQRKGIYAAHLIDEVDEKGAIALKAYLLPHWERLKQMWEPLP